MAFNLGDIIVTIKAKTDDLQRGLGEVEAMASKTQAFGNKISSALDASTAASKKFALGVAAAGAGVVAFGISSVKSFEDSENKIAQTNAVLKSTGGIAGVTADAVDKLSSSLEKVTKFSDEDVRSVENLLLTFTSIGKDIFPQATKTVLDMATALGEDTSSASIQLGKALQDPILGVTALRRVGVNFNSAQQEVIKNLVDTGHSAEAQKLILAELNKEFGGSAEAAGNTFAGQLAKLKNQFDNVKEAVGGFIVGYVNKFLSAMLDWFFSVGGVNGVLDTLRQKFEAIKPYIPAIAGAILGALVPALVAAAISAGEFLLALAPFLIIGAAAGIVARKMGFGMDDLKNILAKVKIYANDVAIGLRLIIDTVTGGDPTLKAGEERFTGIVRALLWMRDTVLGVIQNIKDLYNAFMNNTAVIIVGQFLTQVLWPALQAIGAAIWQNLLPALLQLWDAVVRLWNALNPALMDALKIIGAILLGAFLAALWGAAAVLNILIQVFAGVISAISNVINWISNLIGWFGNLVGTVINIVKIIATILWNLPQAVKDVVRTMIAIFAGIGRAILKAIGNVGGLLYQAGKDLIAGMINGITDKFKELAGAVKNAVGNAVSSVKRFLGIHSPSTVFAEIGRNVTAGFVQGIEKTKGLAANAMDGFGAAVVSPISGPATGGLQSFIGGGLDSFLSANQLSTVPAANNKTSNSTTNIGTINIANAQDAENLIAYLDRDHQLEGLGLSPQR